LKHTFFFFHQSNPCWCLPATVKQARQQQYVDFHAGLASTRTNSSFARKPNFQHQSHIMIECKTPPFWRQFVDVFVDFAATGGKRMWGVPPSDEEIDRRKLPPAILPPAKRIIAIGDLHGDLKKTRQLFQAVGLTNDKDEWIAGDTVAVQVGDQLDRGRNEIEVQRVGRILNILKFERPFEP
jgi:hypothetical protein